ncbi:protein translocase subunit SecF [Candidatus Falkowbacteria bacterium CG10_big_fil_rev_8_21_14_0_10_44_15]|uniref:Protein-export membrane protein SecF n=1 Tax=Candidatus Falkowbacteria bacterium CG10_big_fil_rev_8_21_14_0_10_44_15 TaxID=1974569 RepID=A0A2H0V0K7_9BACT|nr:MAG: protein translocase subunit SecF [Candidatus Falkowbacteria bacterium CG10_big_fil_rev_8_21_14_0_10_44_15]
MRLIYRAKLWLSIAGAVTLVSAVFWLAFGLKPGIDFTGGSLMEVAYAPSERPSAPEIKSAVESANIVGTLNVQLVDDRGAQLRFKEVTEEEHQAILQVLSQGGTATTSATLKQVEELHFETIGPSIGKELKRRATYAIVIALLVIIAYIAWSFRRVSKPVASWKYGVSAIVALFHDVILVVGVFALLGRYAGIEIDTAFIAALLTVLGYSVNDTIVVLDRVRENLPRSNEDFLGTVNASINQTLARSISTTLTTVLALIALLLFGGETIRYFILALTIGIASGAYSSIFIAAPILVIWEKWQRKI